MASPQLKDGFTQIAHEILENTPKGKFNGTQFGILLVVWRQTYGFQRKDAVLSLTDIAKAIGASKSQVDRALTRLIDRKVILVIASKTNRSRALRFNKDYTAWLPEKREQKNMPPAGVPPNKEGAAVPKPAKKKKPDYEPDNRYYRMAEYLHRKIMEHAAMNRVEHLVKDANYQNWADEFRKMIELDERNLSELKEIIDWCTQDSFWSTNILSAKKLREKYAELGIKMRKLNRSGSSREEQGRKVIQDFYKEGEREQAGAFEDDGRHPDRLS